jgi:hypothetical protein
MEEEEDFAVGRFCNWYCEAVLSAEDDPLLAYF